MVSVCLFRCLVVERRGNEVIFMSMQTTQIEIQLETARLLREKAAARNLSLDEYLREMVEADKPLQIKTLDEILAPFRAEVEAKGYSEDELDELFTEARKEIFQAKQQKEQE
jgi:hypothetical protein